jgi:hypothetical protein
MTADAIEKHVLRIAGLVGLAIFVTFFAFTFAVPQWVERFAASFIEAEVIADIDTRINSLRPPSRDDFLSRAAAGVYKRNEQEILRLKAEIQVRSRTLLSDALAAVRDPNCECRRRIELAMQKSDAWRLAQLLADNEKISALIHESYMKLVTDLKREIRVFTGTNAACFALLILISFTKPKAARHLVLPGILLLIATLFCAWLYVFSQNWLLTIIHGSYVGYAYAAYLGIVFLFLCDIALNRGRVTTAIGNGLGSTFNLTPC